MTGREMAILNEPRPLAPKELSTTPLVDGLTAALGKGTDLMLAVRAIVAAAATEGANLMLADEDQKLAVTSQ
jgi:hypothetical protein